MQAHANQPELTGYHVKRDEFEPEYDPDAEQLVAELDFAPGEPQARALPPILGFLEIRSALAGRPASATSFLHPCKRPLLPTGGSDPGCSRTFLLLDSHS